MDKKDLKLMLEPGRSIIANSCALICSVLGSKKSGKKNFLIIDGSMTELLRPALYGSYHHIVPCELHDENSDWEKWDVVGPVCESTDTLATNIELPELRKGIKMPKFIYLIKMFGRRFNCHNGYRGICQ